MRLLNYPFEQGESFGALSWLEISEILEYFKETGAVHKSGSKFFWMAENFPAADISLRSASPNNIVLQSSTDGKLVTIGEVDRESASWMVHPEAIYLHQGETYLVDDLDLDANLAHLKPVEVDFYTRPQRETEIQLLELIEQNTQHRSQKILWRNSGDIRGGRAIGKFRWGTNENLGYGEVSLPPSQLQTTGYWLSLTDQTHYRIAIRWVMEQFPQLLWGQLASPAKCGSSTGSISLSILWIT